MEYRERIYWLCFTASIGRGSGLSLLVGFFSFYVYGLSLLNGKLLRSMKSHTVAVVCLNWQEEGQQIGDDSGRLWTYEDRTSRFFPPAPRVPRMPGVVPGDSGFMDDSENSFCELSNSSHQRFNILCSGDKDGTICFSIFGIFPIGKVNIHKCPVRSPIIDNHIACRLLNASICEVAMSKDLCHLVVMCTGELYDDKGEPNNGQNAKNDVFGLHCLLLDTSIFWKRRNELHQVAQQASSIEDLTEVIPASLSVMCKQWSDAMHAFHEKFGSLSTLITDHGLDSTAQEEFLSLLCGARTSPPVHQFIVNSLGEAGLKRVDKVVCGAGKELQLIVLDHLQFSNFFSWLLKSVKILMSEPSDQLLPCSSELVVIFLRFLYDQDPVKELLVPSEVDHAIEVKLETMQRVKELVQFGGYLDTDYLQRTLTEEFQQMESCFKEAFQMPFTMISGKLFCEDFLPIFPIVSSPQSVISRVPISISYYEEASCAASTSLFQMLQIV